MRKIYYFDKSTGEILPDKQEGTNGERSAFVHGDSMPVTFNHADCKYYDSKSNFRRATKRAGCHEVGNDYQDTERATKHFEEQRREALTKIEWAKEFNQNCDRIARRR